MRNLSSRLTRMLVAPALVIASYAALAQAQWSPTRTVRMIVPYPAGAGVDLVARTLAPKLSEALQQPVVVENKPGAGASIGLDAVAKAQPDGHTLGIGDVGPLAMNPPLYPQLPYDPLRDFSPVTLIATLPQVLVVHPSLGVNSFPEFVAYAKSHPGKLNYASGGNGTPNHVPMELFKQMVGIDMVHVPYKGTAPALTDLLAGNPAVMFANPLSAGPHIKSSKLRAIAVASSKRLESLPDVPTLVEAGLTNFGYQGLWFGVVAPAGTPPAAVSRLNQEIRRVLELPEIRQKLEVAGGMQAAAGTPEMFRSLLEKEVALWSRVIKSSGIKVD